MVADGAFPDHHWARVIVMNAGQRLPAAQSRVFGLVILVWIVALPFVYGAFKAVEWRRWISGIRFGEVSFESDLSSGALYGLYWKVIGWFVLVVLLFAAFIAACSFWILGFGDLSHLGDRVRACSAMVGVFVIGYLGFILAMNIVLRIYLLRDVWARVAASATAFRLEAAANVAAKGELAD